MRGCRHLFDSQAYVIYFSNRHYRYSPSVHDIFPPCISQLLNRAPWDAISNSARLPQAVPGKGCPQDHCPRPGDLPWDC
jgi:hypothetical protein